MSILFFDTETTGKAKDSRVVEIGLVLDDYAGNIVARSSIIIYPEDFEIPNPEIHGVSTEKAKEFGVSLRIALALFHHYATKVDLVVAHNMEYDSTIMLNEYRRFGKDFPEFRTYCTLQATTPICKLPGGYRGQYKWPRLDEAYRLLVNPEGFQGAHSALADTMACREVYYAVKKLEGGGL